MPGLVRYDGRPAALSARGAGLTAAIASFLLGFVALALACYPTFGADAAYGEYLAAECSTCHRAGTTSAASPPLESLSYAELVAALEDYRDGTRSNAAMQSVARSLGDAEIEALAAYFSGSSGNP